MRIHAAFRAIGSFAVRFRWFVLVAWVIAAIAVPRALPSLSSVTQGNNANFLPASAPSEHALKLAAPLGGSTLTPVPVVAASTQGTLTAAEQAWLQKLQQDLGKVPTVVKVRDLGHSPDGQAAQLQVLSNVSQGGAGSGLNTLVKDLRGAISRDGPPSGLDVHLAGAVAIQVDQQAKSGSTDSQIQLLSVVFIIGLLLLVFRALLAPLVTLIPAFLAVTISGPLVVSRMMAVQSVMLVAAGLVGTGGLMPPAVQAVWEPALSSTHACVRLSPQAFAAVANNSQAL